MIPPLLALIEILLNPIATSGAFAALSAYLLWRLREKEQGLHQTLEDLVQAQEETTQSLEGLRSWLEGRLRGGSP